MFTARLPRTIPCGRKGITKPTHHLYSTTSSKESDAATIATSFLSKFQARGPETRTQLLDANQLHLLTLTLNRPHLYPSFTSPSATATAPKDGTPLPPGYHLVYFTPSFLESELGADGTDASYNPSAPFTRRMWAGGEVIWPRQSKEKPNLLRIGQTVTETTRVLNAEPKVVRKTGEEMIVVGVEKRFENESGLAVIDRRNWVFREALPNPPPAKTTPTAKAGETNDIPPPIGQRTPSANQQQQQQLIQEGGIYRRSLRQTPVSLFRFSALTFNPHKIHYSLPWARDVEGHPNIVVHGPLNLINMLDLWRDIQYAKHDQLNAGEEGFVVPESIAYRATNPLYAEDDYEIVFEEDAEKGVGNVNVFNHIGVVSMKANIKA